MKNFSLTAIICQIIGALACIGLGIYFCVVNEDVTRIVVFFIVGAICIVNAVRMYLKYRKEKKDGDDN